MAFLTTAEFATLLGRTLTLEEEQRVSMVLDMASGMVAEHADLLYIPAGKQAPETVRGVVFEMSRRAFVNPNGFAQMSVGDVSSSFARSDTSSVGLMFSASELQRLDRWHSSSGTIALR